MQETPEPGSNERVAKVTGRPSPEKQAEAVAALMKQHGTMKEGQKWTLIASRWLEAWVNHTKCKAFWQYRPDEKSTGGFPAPDAIDNSPLKAPPRPGAGDTPDSIVQIRLNAQEIRDFFYVPKPVWEVLVSWYGGGPLVERGTKLAGVIEKRVKVDLHPVFLLVSKCKSDGEADNENTMALPCPREGNLGEVLKTLAAEGSSSSSSGSPKERKGESPMETEDSGETEGKETENKDKELPVRFWYLETKRKEFPFKVGERVEACYNNEWYIGDLDALPVEDEYNRYSVICDVDKKAGKSTPKTLVKVIRRVEKLEGEGDIVSTWRPVTGAQLTTELGILKLAKGGVCKLMVERKVEGKWVRELKIKKWRDFQVDDNVDCKDTQFKWLPAVIKKVRTGDVYVHYVGYKERWDEWIPINSDRLAEPGSKCKERGVDDDDYYSSSSWGSGAETRGSVGLRNLGNTCFMNSTLQCMNATPSLVNFFVDGDYLSQINPDAYKSHGRIAKEFGALVKEMWASRPHTVTPRNFKSAIGEFAPRFSGYAQQDSQELLACLLEGLHEDLNRVRKKPYFPDPAIGNGTDDEKVAAKAWKMYQAREDSVVIDNIYGQIRSQVICPECNKASVKFDECGILQLPFPSVDTKVQVITVVPADITKPRIKYGVTVNKNGKIADLKDATGVLSGIKASRLAIAEVYTGKIYKVLSPKADVSSIMDNDVIYAFECPLLDPENMPGTGVILAKVKHNSEDHRSSITRESIPFVVALPARKMKAGEMKEIVGASALAHMRKSEGKGAAATSGRPFKIGFKTSSYGEDYKYDEDEEYDLGSAELLAAVVTWNDSDDYASVPIHEDKTIKDLGGAGGDMITLNGCLQAFTKEEVLTHGNEYRCPTCKKMQRGKKKLDLWRLPNILIVQLKRFQYTRAWRDKIDTNVDYPLEGLDMAPWTKSKEFKRNAIYDLYAVSCHGGGLGGGHYWAYAKNLVDKNWYTLNDSSVRKMSEQAVKTKEAYLLFYARRGFDGTRAARDAQAKSPKSSS